MNEKEAYAFIAERLGLTPEAVPWLLDVAMEQTIINPVLPETVKKLGPVLDLRPGKTVLDLACGKGGVSLPMVHTYKVKLTGVDVMPDYIREAWSRAEYSGIYEMCRFVIDDAARFAQAADGRWDVVIVMGALPYIWPDFDDGIEKAKKLIEPGGHLVLGHPYLKPDGVPDPHLPLESKADTQARLAGHGEVVQVFDDGDAGWEAYIAPQKKTMADMRERKSDNQVLMAFLDEWEKQQAREIKNLGFAVWVVKVG